MASMLACAACTRSLPSEHFAKAQVKKGPQKIRCKACVTAEAPLPVAVVTEAEASVVAPPDVERSMDVDMEQPEESGAKEQPKDGSGIPQRARSAKSRIKKEAPQQGRSAALAVPSNGACASCASCGSGRPKTPRVRGPG